MIFHAFWSDFDVDGTFGACESVGKRASGGIDSVTEEMLEGYKEPGPPSSIDLSLKRYKNARGHNVGVPRPRNAAANEALQLVNPENCVRWRYQEAI